MILVTGGTGLLGSHLLLQLLKNGEKVKALYRNEQSLKEVEAVFSYYIEDPKTMASKIEWVAGDITDLPSLENAFVGVTQVYHLAALISFNPAAWDQLKKTNVEGTANVVNLCLANKVEKLCYASSIAAIGQSLDTTPITEENDWIDADVSVYAVSKYRAEMEVWRGSQEGLKVVVVNPGIILGPGNWDHGSARLFKNAAKGLRAYFPGGTGFVSVHDVVAMAMILMQQSIANERFIAVGENLSFQEVFSMMSESFGLPVPKKKIPLALLEIGWRLDWCRRFFFRTKRKLTKNTVQSLRNRKYYSSKKAEETLGFQFEGLSACIETSCRLLRQRYTA